MSSERQVRANQANARKSTGPQSGHGKSRASKNALRHGLSIPVSLDPSCQPDVERLAVFVAGLDANPDRLDAARRLAEAHIDVLRVRQARHMLLCDEKVRVKQPTLRQGLRAVMQLLSGKLREDTIDVMEAMQGVNKPGESLTLVERFDGITAELLRLDRYERRALSRRKFAIRDFDDLRVEKSIAN